MRSNFGAVAGMTEMLVQSQDGVISILPALPDKWKNVRVKGLKARGNFTIDLSLSGGKLDFVDIYSEVGGQVKIGYGDIQNVIVTSWGKTIDCQKTDIISFETQSGKTYRLTGFGKVEPSIIAEDFSAEWKENGVLLSWKSCGKFAIYRGKDSEKDYRFIGLSDSGSFLDGEYNDKSKALLTYKVVAVTSGKHSSGVNGAVAVVNPATELEKERYKLKFRMNNINLE